MQSKKLMVILTLVILALGANVAGLVFGGQAEWVPYTPPVVTHTVMHDVVVNFGIVFSASQSGRVCYVHLQNRSANSETEYAHYQACYDWVDPHQTVDNALDGLRLRLYDWVDEAQVPQ